MNQTCDMGAACLSARKGNIFIFEYYIRRPEKELSVHESGLWHVFLQEKTMMSY